MSSVKEMRSQRRAAKKKLTLVSCDGVSFEVDEAVATEFKFKQLGDCTNNRIVLPTVKSEILAKVLEYCNKHVEAGADEDLKAWDAKFVSVDQMTLYDLMAAATDMKIYVLVVLVSKTVARLINGKTREQIWELCGLPSEITPQVRERLMLYEKVINAGVMRTMLKRYL